MSLRKVFPIRLSIIEIGICAQIVCIAAESLGLGSVYIGNVIDFLPKLRDMFNIPKYVCPAILLCAGFPERKIKPRKRLGREIIVHREKYQDFGDGLKSILFYRTGVLCWS